MRNLLELLKYHKSPGPDEIINELLKYGGSELNSEMTMLFKLMAKQQNIPTNCENIRIPMFKTCKKTSPVNY